MFVARTVVAAIFSLSTLSVHAKKCGDNFSHFGNSCVCLSPFQLCNDKCGSWKSCHSGIPHHDHQPDHNNHKRGADQQLMDGRLCPSGETICGGLSGEGSYECIDTKSTLDSCGGCAYPVPGRTPDGRDCSAIEGVVNVRCQDSQCIIEGCKEGWAVNLDTQSCIAVN